VAPALLLALIARDDIGMPPDMVREDALIGASVMIAAVAAHGPVSGRTIVANLQGHWQVPHKRRELASAIARRALGCVSPKTHSFTVLDECPAVAFRALRLAAILWISCGKDTQVPSQLKVWRAIGDGGCGQMLGQKVLPAILFLLPATSALTVHATVVEAASTECKAKPDSVAPAGTRWYYRANRVDHSRCWFLSSRTEGVHSRLRQTISVTGGQIIGRNTGEVPDAQQNRQDAQQDRQVGQHVASPIEPAVDLSASRQTMVPQLTRVPDRPRSHKLIARKVATIPYRLSVASAQPASGALVQARPSASQASAGVANFNLVFLGAAATGLSLAGGVFHLTRRVRSRDPALTDRPNRRIVPYPPEPVVDGLEVAKQQPCSIGQPARRQLTGLTADDLNRRLREVRRNLQRAGFARAA
jgi:hypothetical protein